MSHVKKTNDKDKIKKAKRLKEIKALLSPLNKEKNELVKYFKTFVKPGESLQAGDVIIIVTKQSFESWDKDTLKSVLGNKIQEYITMKDKINLNVA